MAEERVRIGYSSRREKNKGAKSSYQICLELLIRGKDGNETLRWRCLEISDSDLIPHLAYDGSYYCLHDHIHGDPQRFRPIPSRPLSCPTPAYRFSNGVDCSAVLGSTIYTFDGRECELLSLDAAKASYSSNLLSWTTVPKPFALVPRFIPKLVAMGGRLYLLGVAFQSPRPPSFGAIYDPLYESWTEIDGSLTDWNIGVDDRILAMPLGGSIFVVGPHLATKKLGYQFMCDYVDPKAKGEGGESRLKHAQLPEVVRDVSSKFVSVEEEKTLYWINMKGLFCAYRWETKEFVSGPIFGLENEVLLHLLAEACVTVPSSVWGKTFFVFHGKNAKIILPQLSTFTTPSLKSAGTIVALLPWPCSWLGVFTNVFRE